MKIILRIINWAVLIFGINLPIILRNAPLAFIIPTGIVLFLYFTVFNIFPTMKKYPTFRLKILGDGAELILAFWVTGCVSLCFAVPCIVHLVRGVEDYAPYIAYGIVLIVCEAVIFWNGIIRVYLTSVQLGIRYRVWGVILGMILPANLVMLMMIYIKVRREVITETEKFRLNESRRSEKICETKYPILLVHGVFFRDNRILNYWGRIPAELKKNGATIYYGDQQSALSIEDSSKELANKIGEIVMKTGCGKVNIIAHSKGGLDSRYAITHRDCAKYVASLTTINTPHRGCIFAEALLNTVKPRVKRWIEKVYNKTFYALGDDSPDFMAAVKDLTNSRCEAFNKITPDSPEVMYQSFGSKARNSRSGRFPLNVSYPIVKKYDGDNDGLVALDSAPWGERFTAIYPKGRRGVTHADMIDLNREDIKGFDVREFYVQLVSELREKGF